MSEITCTATMSAEAIEINLDGNDISISLKEDIDFTKLAEHLTNLIERKSGIEMTWTERDEPTDKENVAKGVIDKIINSFNQVIEKQFEEEVEDDPF